MSMLPNSADHRRFAPATERNRVPILAILDRVLPRSGIVLEIASGSGEHAQFFAKSLGGVTWQPSDPDPDARASITAWTAASGLANVAAPLALDTTASPWPIDRADAIVAINMVHISPWAATLGLFTGAASLLPAGAPLYLYGPYRRAEAELAPSNLTFDRNLRLQNPAWGLRELDAVTDAADASGFTLLEVIEMPANNLSLVFRRR